MPGQSGVPLRAIDATAPKLPLIADLAISAAATALVTGPLWLIRFAPLHDFPFHVARMQILHDLFHGGVQAQFYELNRRLLPNLGMDVVVSLLAEAISVELASRLVIVGIVFLMISGAGFLHRSLFNERGLAIPLAALLSYNAVLTAGFINYLFSIGLLLWSFGLTIRLRNDRAPRRLLFALVLAIALFFTHLVAFVLNTVIVAGIALQASWPLLRTAPRRAMLLLFESLLPSLVVAAIFLSSMPTAGSTEQAAVQVEPATLMAVVKAKWWLVTRMLAGGENRTLDLVTAGAAAAVTALLVAFGRPRIAPSTRLANLLICATFLLAPGAMLTAIYLDARLPLVIALCLISCTQFRFAGTRSRAIAIGLLFVLAGARSVVLANDWIGYDRVERQFTDAFACLPPHAILFSGRGSVEESGLWSGHWQPPIAHIASLATVTNEAFVPQTWAHPAQQPIVLRPGYAEIYAFQSPNPLTLSDAQSVAGTVARIRDLTRNGGPRPGGAGWSPFLLVLEPQALGRIHLDGVTLLVDRPLFALYQIDGVSPPMDRPESCRLPSDGGPEDRSRPQ